MVRIFRNSLLILPLLLVSIVPSAVHAIEAQDTTISWRTQSDDFADRGFSSGFELFYAGPEWFLNALSNPRSRNPFVKSFLEDSAGDRLGVENGYVGTLHDVFDVNLFSNIATFGGSAAPKTQVPTISATNTPYYFSGAGVANWDGLATWGPAGGYPNGSGDSAVNLQEINGQVIQNVSLGVTVGIIANDPTTPGNSGQSVSWTITTTNPIFLQSGSNAPAQISNTQAIGTSSLTIQGTTYGLRLVSDLTITNANPGALVTISAPISDATVGGNRNIATVGPGTTLLTGSNTFGGTTTINSGTLNLGGQNALGGTSGVTVNAGGTLLLSNDTTNDRIKNDSPITLSGGTLKMNGVSEGAAGANGVGALTLLNTSTIDFAAGVTNSIIQFAGLGTHTPGALLNITNWDGTIGTGGGSERLLFAGDPSAFSNQYSQTDVVFNNTPGYLLVDFGGFYEVTEVPEPSTWIGGALALGAIGFTQRRRLSSLIARRA